MMHKILIFLFISTVAFGQFISEHTGEHIDSTITATGYKDTVFNFVGDVNIGGGITAGTVNGVSNNLFYGSAESNEFAGNSFYGTIKHLTLLEYWAYSANIFKFEAEAVWNRNEISNVFVDTEIPPDSSIPGTSELIGLASNTYNFSDSSSTGDIVGFSTRYISYDSGSVANVYGYKSTTPYLPEGSITGDYFHFYGDGDNPSYLGGDLEVSGIISLDDGSENTVVGFEALNSISETDGWTNTALGYKVLYNADSANGNVGVGYFAMYSLTNGSDNLGVGSAALYYLTEGNYNVGVGNISLQDLTTGDYNTGLGYSALENLTTPDNNTGIGYAAGMFITGGSTPNLTSSNSVYLGALTKAGADGNTNEIVIGYETTGSGSNTVTIGNTNIIGTILRGDIKLSDITSDSTSVTTGELWFNSSTGAIHRKF